MDFREFMSMYPTGVTIVTAFEGNRPYGLTVNSFTSLSLDPLLILICIKKGKRSHYVINNASHFCVNILGQNQENLSVRFADPALEDKRFENLEYEIRSNCPIIKGCIGYIICEKYASFDGGDHTIFLGKVIDYFKGKDNLPLIFYKRGYYTVKL
jgi:Conserved protein/domain typically associated with flavoprotein oxygenases, DIM6/NTAB family